MSWIAAIGLGITAAGTIYQVYQGEKQSDRADDLQSGLGPRPQMQLAQGYTDALTSAQQQAKMTRLPGQGAIEGRLDQTTANQISMLERASLGGPDMINAASRVYGNQQDAENQLGISAASMRLHNQDILRNEEHIVGDQQNQLYGINQLQPWQDKSNAIAALREGSMRNINAGVQNLAGTVGNGLMGYGMRQHQPNWYEQWAKSPSGQNDAYGNSMYNNGGQYTGFKTSVGGTPQRNVLDGMFDGMSMTV